MAAATSALDSGVSLGAIFTTRSHKFTVAECSTFCIVLMHAKPLSRDWCKGQMKLLNGSEDLTLVEFLMGLASSGETAEYIQLYLGNSPAGKPAVAAFTMEFLRCGFYMATCPP